MVNRLRFIWIGLWILGVVPLVDGQIRTNGFVGVRAVDGQGPASWAEGGTGRFILGQDADLGSFAQLQFGLDWDPSLYFGIHAHGIGRSEPDSFEGNSGGISELYLKLNAFFSDRGQLRFRLGYFFPPTSLENVDPLWSSPYSLSLSALNSWIAEEIRHTGLDISYSITRPQGTFFAGATLVANNDAIGALLAWRGWSQHDRLTTYGEVLPLPELASLEGGVFDPQRDDGTKPFGPDLDGRLSYSARVGYESNQFLFQATWLENDGDRELHRGEYAWESWFLTLGLEVMLTHSWNMVGEYVEGSTGMGLLPGPHVQVDLDAWYLLTSYDWGSLRGSLRYESFNTSDQDQFAAPFNADLNTENGSSVTASLFWRFWEDWRLGVEWLHLDVDRPTVLASGMTTVTGGRTLALELRYFF